MKKALKLCLLSSIALGCLQIDTLLAMEAPLPEKSSYSAIKQKKFLSLHDRRFNPSEVEKLIEKGQGIVASLLSNEKPEEIFKRQKLDIFSDKGKRFAGDAIVRKAPTTTSVSNFLKGGR